MENQQRAGVREGWFGHHNNRAQISFLSKMSVL